MNHQNQKIKEIMKSYIPPIEKQRQIQNILTLPKSTESVGSVKDCTHYLERKCMILAECCSEYFSCRFCHDEFCDHTIDRFAIKTIKCKQCNIIQPVSHECSRCLIQFDKNFCKECNLWSSKNIFHCFECGFCRVGLRESYSHCKMCNLCVTDGHECNRKRISKTCCPYCLDPIEVSNKTIMPLRCGHYVHQSCLMDSKSNICPLCKRTIFDMTEAWNRLRVERSMISITDPVLAKDVVILCCDCSMISEVRWHIVGLECIHCHSFNTTMK